MTTPAFKAPHWFPKPDFSIVAGAVLYIITLVGNSWAQTDDIRRVEEGNPVPLSLIEVFEPGSLSVPLSDHETQTFNYQLFRPRPLRDQTQFPLLVWVHGIGEYEVGVHNTGQLKWVAETVFRNVDDLSRYPFYFVAMQCVADDWDEPCSKDRSIAFDSIDANIMLIDQLLADAPIDRRRVYLIGISSGGTACWEMSKRRPDLFAAVAPLACVPPPLHGWSERWMIPLWTFRSTADVSPPMSNARESIALLRRLGSPCLLTEVDTGGHDAWTTAFLDYDLLNWLLAQHQGCHDCPPPGSLSLTTRWHLLCKSRFYVSEWLLPIGFLTFVIASYYAVRRERQRRKQSQQLNKGTSSPLKNADF